MTAKEARDLTITTQITTQTTFIKAVYEHIKQNAEEGLFHCTIHKSYVNEAFIDRLIEDGYKITEYKLEPPSGTSVDDIEISWRQC